MDNSRPTPIPNRVEVVEPCGHRHVIPRDWFELLVEDRFFRDGSTVRGYHEEYPQPVYTLTMTTTESSAPPRLSPMHATLRHCPSCARPISLQAHACPGCGHAFVAAPGQSTGRALACVLSLFIPGLGQLTQGRVGVGFAFLASTLLWLVGIGPVFHLLAAIEAWHYRPSRA